MKAKVIKNLENKMEKIQESIKKDLEELKNKNTNNTIIEIKNTLEGINSSIPVVPAQKEKCRPMEQDRKPRNKPMCTLRVPYF